MANKKVLIIDDDEAIRESIGDVLEMNGFLPILASDGAEGLQYMRNDRTRPSLVLLDMMMPGVNGWEFLDVQRTDPSLSEIPVVVCSAFTEIGKSVHADGFLAKPLELKALLRTVGSLSH